MATFKVGQRVKIIRGKGSVTSIFIGSEGFCVPRHALADAGPTLK
jgi:hypothetical protein